MTAQQLAPPTDVRPKTLGTHKSVDPSARRASRTASPHRVSFSPSTAETALAREEALAFAALASESSAKPSPTNDESHRSRAAKTKKKKVHLAKWRVFKSKSTSDLHDPTHRPSLDSVRTGTSDATSSSSQEVFEDRAALPGAAATKRCLFRWDRKGIHRVAADGSRDKGKVAKVMVTKHQALAARHAKTLEQVINAGTGLHPVPARVCSARHAREANSADTNAKGGKKKHVPRAKPIPVVDRSQLRGLKSALLDVDHRWGARPDRRRKRLRGRSLSRLMLRRRPGKRCPRLEPRRCHHLQRRAIAQRMQRHRRPCQGLPQTHLQQPSHERENRERDPSRWFVSTVASKRRTAGTPTISRQPRSSPAKVRTTCRVKQGSA